MKPDYVALMTLKPYGKNISKVRLENPEQSTRAAESMIAAR